MKSHLHIAVVLFALGVVAFFSLPEGVYAHGEAGITFTSTTTEGHIVDVDYLDAYIEAGVIGTFDFGLFTDNTRQKKVEFTDIWVRIMQKDGSRVRKTLFAGAVARDEFGGSGFSFVFPEGGTYTLSVRYNDDNKNKFDNTVGEAEFELNVLRSTNEEKFNFGMEFWVGLMVGVFALAILVLPLLLKKKQDT